MVVKLDHGIAPVGLRDLPAIDATFEAAREFKWNEVADAVRDIIRMPLRRRTTVTVMNGPRRLATLKDWARDIGLTLT